MSSVTTTSALVITLENSLDYLIDQCWSKCIGNKEKIILGQIPVLINEIQTILKIDSLFTSTEVKYIGQFLDEYSDWKFNKSEVKKFIVSSISAESFANLLRDRFGLTNEVVRRRIKDSRPSDTTDSFRIWRNSQNTAESKAKVIKDEEIEKLRKEIAMLKQSNEEKEIRLKISEREINGLNTRLADLSTIYKNRGNDEKSLAAQLAEKNAALVESTRLCKKYKEACVEYKQREKETELALKTLEREVAKQNEMIEFLQNRLPLGQDSGSVKQLLVNLPIVKQGYFFLKYKHDLKDKRVLMVSIISTICFFLLLLNGLQLIYMIVSVILASLGKDSGIVYDNDRIRSPGVIDLISTVPSIEKFIYDYIDW
ncbi:hypothetical protein CANMA_001799 [Candida margitis]|uniref:uncharacterized protein n=1 Tax=Candida margitis TaxID=1775924 RepID=UPI0022273002|nr:uncharacterized protein CANMA_001799 [Candida margitis]KAI5969132.1 hypothetical protein CANMA_001799 [Candida margitis]